MPEKVIYFFFAVLGVFTIKRQLSLKYSLRSVLGENTKHGGNLKRKAPLTKSTGLY